MNQYELISLLEQSYPGYDCSFLPCFYYGWSDYEEYYEFFILEKNGEYYLQESGHSVYNTNSKETEFCPQKIQDDELLEILERYSDED